MKPHHTPHRIRKTIKWGGAVVTVLLVVVWIGSGWWGVFWLSECFPVKGESWCVSVEAAAGTLVLRWEREATDGPLPGWAFGRPYGPFRWGFDARLFKDIGTVETPLWIPPVVSGAIWLWVWVVDSRARRRAPLNLCPKCNYDRTGLAIGAKCPECGQATA